MTPLHHIGEFVRNLMLLVPLPAVRILFIAVYVLLLLWVLSLPREAVTPPDGKGGWDSNLKVGAGIAIGIQLIVYSLW